VSDTSFTASIIMFFSYFLAGFIPLGPYLFLPLESAFWISITVSLISLFILGIIGAKISQTNIFKGGMRMILVGGLALGAGTLVGTLLGGM